MDWKKKGVFLSAGVLLLLVVIAGCSSVPKQPDNPYLGYVYYRTIQGDTKLKQDGVASQLRKYELEIASLEFQRHQRGFRGIQKERSLEKITEYIEALERPIVIEKAQWKGALDQGLKKKEKTAVLAYWEANRPLSFSGSKVLDEWGDTLYNVRAQRGADARKAADAEKLIEDLRRENRYREALTKVELLRPYKPAEARDLVESVKKEASDYWAGQCESELDELKAARPYDGAHEQRVMALFAKVNEDVNAFGHREAFNGVYNEWMELLGDNWRTRIVQLGAEKEYWEAYGFVWKRYHEYVDTVRFAETYRKGLRLAINKGYLEILDNALRYYSDLASKNAFNKGHGKAYVYCCMAKEMYDFVTVARIDYAGEEAEKYYLRITDLEKNELVPALDARISRRLLIHDLEMDRQGLAKEIRSLCQKKYASGNDLAWGLEVVTDKNALAQLGEATLSIEPEDYVLEWNYMEYDVDRDYGTPIPQIAYIKTDRIKLVDNPDRRNKSSEFYKLKQVKAQEVDQYSLIQTINGVDLVCSNDVSCLHRGSKIVLEMAEAEERVKEINAKLHKVTNITCTLALENVLSKTEYYKPDKNNREIPKDEPPSNAIVDMPDEDWFEEQVANYILKDLDAGLEGVIKMYPVELLADAALEESSEYLNTLGTVLYYVAKLSEVDAAKRDSAGFNYEWLHLRDQIDSNMKKWCGIGGRWGAYSGETKVLKSLWEECISAGAAQDEL